MANIRNTPAAAPKLTEYVIQNVLYSNLWQKGQQWLCPNVYLYAWESDLISVTKAGFIHEYEIKISRSDFKNDANKVEKHQHVTTGMKDKLAWRKKWDTTCTAVDMVPAARPNCFWYVCPENLISIDEVPAHAGLIHIIQSYSGAYYPTVIKHAPKLHKEPIKPLHKDKIATALYYRYWRYRMKLSDKDIEVAESAVGQEESADEKTAEGL